MNVLVTGATGFIGSELLVSKLGSSCSKIVAVTRKLPQNPIPKINYKIIDSIDLGTRWEIIENSIDVVIHCAARAHILKDHSADPMAEFRRVNVDGTLNLARQAVAAGVRRFIFISSIGVNGNSTVAAFSENHQPNPIEPYALSKLEAELGLQELASSTNMELVIIRPPLVYGPNAPGNFGRLIRAVAKGLPLPLGAINNKRTLVSLDNLIDFIWTCVHHPAAANHVFLVGDGEDLSTTELLLRMAKALGVSSLLIPVPIWLLQSGASVIGKTAMVQRLCGSLQVDISKAREVLGWQPPVTPDEALEKTAKAFLATKRV